MTRYHVADVRSISARSWPVRHPIEIGVISQADLPQLAELYRRAYDLSRSSYDEALAEMESAFDGTWGELWLEASPVARAGDDLMGVVATVRRPAMPDAPECPWLIEVFTDPDHRRAGIARALVRAACATLAVAGARRVGLTVDEDNIAALHLYQSIGFSPMP